MRFDDETLALAFRPTPKTGLNINPVNLAQLVVLKGPWLDPKLALDAQGVAGMAASLGLAGATGGLVAAGPAAAEGRAREGRVPHGAERRRAEPGRHRPHPPLSRKPPLKLPKALPEALRNIFK